MAEGPYHEPEAQKRLAGGEATGCREHPPSPCHRAPEGAREAFDSGVAFTSLLASFQGASESTKSQAFNSAANFGQHLSKCGL